MLQQHQGGQPHDFGLGGKQAQQQPPEADRLVAQPAAQGRLAAAGGIALVEQQVDHGRHRRQALGPLHRAGRLEGRAGLGHLGLGPGDPLLHGALAHQEGAGDLGHAQATDDPQGQSNLLGGRQVGMAADEQQPQDVVAIVGAVQPLHQIGLGVLQVGDQHLLRQGRLAGLAAHAVQGRIAPDEDQPGGGVAGRPFFWPVAQGAQARLLEGLFSDVEVAEVSQQGGHGLGPRGRQGPVDPGQVAHCPASAGRALAW